LGLIPIYMGIKSAFNLMSQKVPHGDKQNVAVERDNQRIKHLQLFYVASVTIANGGDNVGIYIPLFATLTISKKLTMAFIFLMMTALWCFAARYLSKHPMIRNMVGKYGHIITPFVFILLGVYIIYESNTVDLFLND
jgi:cadmium resistance protein CadD (predicted permease)